VKTRFSIAAVTGLITAEFFSLLGNQIAAIAIPILVLQQTHSTMVTGIAVLANNFPFVFAALIGGKSIDRFGAWQVSIISDLLSFISVLALPIVFIMYSGNIPSFLLLILIFLGALFDPTGISARNSLVPELSKLGGRRLNYINALRGGLENAADFAGPIVGIGIISLVSINNTFFINALSFLFSALLFASTVPKLRHKTVQENNSDIFLGLRIIFSNVQLRTLAVTGIISGFVISSFLGVLLIALAIQGFHNTALSGISLSAFSFSATVTALLFSKLSRSYSFSFIYYVGLLIIGPGICLCGAVTTQYGVVFSAVLAGAAGTGNPLEQTILQQETSKQNAGQVFAALPAIRFAAGSIGLLLTGWLAEFYSINKILLLEGSVLIVTAVCGWFIAPLKRG